jgi:hypothetical protein
MRNISPRSTGSLFRAGTPSWARGTCPPRPSLEVPMARMTRRKFLATLAASAAAGGTRLAPVLATRTGGRRILTLVYDKSLGMMRAVERVVP